MKKIATPLILCMCMSVLFIACEPTQKENTIKGLWLVEKVQKGTKEMTPIAKWSRFNEDHTHSSGNGWLQHSVGDWKLQEDKLYLQNKNGITDPFEAFQVSVQGNEMTWKRKEQEDTVQVFLRRIEKLPSSNSDKLLGLWKLVDFLEEGKSTISKINSPEKAMIHFRWDHVYVQYNMPRGKRYGVYKVHGHKPEIQMINYGKDTSFDFWKIKITKDTLTMTSTDGTTEMKYQRAYQFPQ
jgi:hypothetical protein